MEGGDGGGGERIIEWSVTHTNFTVRRRRERGSWYLYGRSKGAFGWMKIRKHKFTAFQVGNEESAKRGWLIDEVVGALVTTDAAIYFRSVSTLHWERNENQQTKMIYHSPKEVVE